MESQGGETPICMLKSSPLPEFDAYCKVFGSLTKLFGTDAFTY